MGGEHTHRARRVAAVVVTAALAVACSASGGDTAGGAVTTPADQAPAPPATRAPLPVPARYAGFRSETYADPAHWVCRPDTDDVCDKDLDATVVAADGTLTVERFTPAADAPIDCFYVYPTISRDPTPTSDLIASPIEEGAAARAQVARLGTHCRVFAPTYRQFTLSALTGAMGGRPMTGGGNPGQSFADVVDAWKHYMANDNGGRGVVLVGHSQGAGMVTQLIKAEIDGNADVRDHLVSAFIVGAPGAEGDFANVPLCRRPDQVGCVVTWASFRSTSPPPPNTRFARIRGTETPAACVSPAAVAGGKAVSRPYFGSSPAQSIITPDGDPAKPWVAPAKGAVTTPWVTTPGLIEVECVERNGYGYLEVTVKGDPADPRADDIGGDLTPDWGLHLADANLVMGDMVELVGHQVESFTRSGG